MARDPVDYRQLYKDEFMLQTLDWVSEGDEFKVRAFHSNRDARPAGFPDSWILLKFQDLGHTDVSCVNVLSRKGDSFRSVIFVNSDLLNQSREDRKFCLAHEWIHTVECFELAKNDSGIALPTKRVSGKVELALLLNAMNAPAPWQDTEDEMSWLISQLRRLLVSEASISEFAEMRLKMNLKDLKALAYTQPKEFLLKISVLRDAFASERSVNRDIVGRRINQIVWSGR